MAVYTLKASQKIPSDIASVWDFISSPRNLKEITPDYMGFEIKGELPEKMYPGLLIQYRVSPLLGIKMTWVTGIGIDMPISHLHGIIKWLRVRCRFKLTSIITTAGSWGLKAWDGFRSVTV